MSGSFVRSHESNQSRIDATTHARHNGGGATLSRCLSCLISHSLTAFIMDNRPQVFPPMKSEEEVLRLLQKYPLPLNDHGGAAPMKFAYGTAGFRYDASLLDSIMVRVGILAAVRSSQLQHDVGVMVTASHNDESFNGVKIADPNGGMMAPDGEALAVELANASLDELRTFLKTCQVSDSAVVHVGRDTRSHSPHLSQLTIRAAQAMGITVVSHGIVTTPMLHHAVLHANPQYLPLMIPPRPNVEGYYELLAHSYHNLLLTAERTILESMPQQEPLVVDCACGVGYAPVVKLNEMLQRISPYCRKLVARNAPGEGPLNEGCGSEHVQKEISPPKWYTNTPDSKNPRYAASLDGDADRIVFFTESPQFALLDGDKIAVLICDFLQEQVDDLKVALESKSTTLLPLKLGVVQTAYANGAATDYLRGVMDNVLIAKTGVKHVHTAAHDNFDIAVYFEANGHGTVLFSKAFYNAMTKAHEVVPENVALQRLCILPSLVNQAVGDALSDLLLMDAILQLKQWNIQTWNDLYTDLPSRQCKIKVQDRSIIQTNENETRATHPPKLQEALDVAMANISGGRCFVRPSGTENVVRVYAEAKASRDADTLASKTAQLVHTLCNGVGEAPSFPSSNL